MPPWLIQDQAQGTDENFNLLLLSDDFNIQNTCNASKHTKGQIATFIFHHVFNKNIVVINWLRDMWEEYCVNEFEQTKKKHLLSKVGEPKDDWFFFDHKNLNDLHPLLLHLLLGLVNPHLGESEDEEGEVANLNVEPLCLPLLQLA